MRICLTGGIACGKSLFARHLKDFGVDFVDADDIVHELIPAEERRRLAPVLFADPVARKAHEAKIHPVVRARIAEALAASLRPIVAVVPLVFEAGMASDFDYVICLRSSPERQLARLTEKRGLSAEAARARLAAQMPIDEKAARSDCVVENDGTPEALREKARILAARIVAMG